MSEISPERRAELERLATEATPGPWRKIDGDALVYGGVDIDRLADTSWDVGDEQAGKNAAYIAAASPEAVLALLRDLREVEGLLRRSLAFRDDSDPAEYSAFLAEVMSALKENADG